MYKYREFKFKLLTFFFRKIFCLCFSYHGTGGGTRYVDFSHRRRSYLQKMFHSARLFFCFLLKRRENKRLQSTKNDKIYNVYEAWLALFFNYFLLLSWIEWSFTFIFQGRSNFFSCATIERTRQTETAAVRKEKERKEK